VSIRIGDRDAVAQAARDLHAVLAGQLEVENEQVDRVARQGRVELATAGQRSHAQVVLRQVFGQQFAHRGSSSSATTCG
jgi:hypothetical protein